MLLAVALLTGCRQNPPPPSASTAPPGAATPDPATNWVQVHRWMDDAGLTHNDHRTITSADQIAALKAFFPALGTTEQSTLHANLSPWIVINFHTADGTDTYISTDYRIYRIDEGGRGDFVVAPGFIDAVQRLFAAP